MSQTRHRFHCATTPLSLLLMSLLVFAPFCQARELSSSHGVEIDSSQPFPALLYSDLLKSMSDQVFWETGQLRFFERVRLSFLPDFKDPQHIAAYNPHSGAFLVSQIIDASGDAVQTVYWEARREKFPIWAGQAVNNSAPTPLEPGNYTLRWSVDGTPFWAMEFSVASSGAASAYEKGHSLLQGPWQDWVYVYVPDGNLSAQPSFNLFLRDPAARAGNWSDQVVVIEVMRDGELVAQHGHNAGASRPASIVQAKPWWVAHEFSLRNASDDGFVAASELTAPGSYEIVVTVNGEQQGRYRYRANGTLPRPELQDRERADPMRFLEGLTDRFYLRRE